MEPVPVNAANTRPTFNRFYPAARLILATLCLVSGLATLLFVTQPYSALKPLADRLARDGSLEMFTPGLYARLSTWLPVLGGFLLASAAALLVFPVLVHRLMRFLVQGTRKFFTSLLPDTRTFWVDLRHRLLKKDILIPLAGMTFFAFLVRIWFVNVPVEHDEAYNFTVFAVHPLRMGLADYHFPNNHLFHTFLMHIAYRLFGADTWVLRLPVLIAGVLLAPLGYLLARRLYDRMTALLAGAAIAAAPVLVTYATYSRGYSLLALLTLVMFILALELKQRSNTVLWLGFVLAGALGMYTVPVFAYPLGIVYTWLALTWLLKDLGPTWKPAGFFAAVFFSGIGTLLLTLLLYLPVFRSSGVASVVANPYVASLSWKSFWPTLLSRLPEIWRDWNQELPWLVTVLALIGLVASVILHRRLCRERIPIPLAALIFLPFILVIQRPNAWARLWVFLVPLILIWCAAGLVGLFGLVESGLKNKINLTQWLIAMLVFAMIGGSAYRTWQKFPGLAPVVGPVEESAIYLRDHLEAQQIVVVTSTDDAPLWFYFYKYHLSQELFRRNVPFRSAYVVVSTDKKQTLESVLADRGPDLVFLNLPAAHRVAQFGSIDLYQVPPHWDIIQKEYHLDQP